MVIVDGVTKRFGAITGVDNISFGVSDGELFGKESIASIKEAEIQEIISTTEMRCTQLGRHVS